MKLFLDFLPLLLFFATFMVAKNHADAAADFATRHFGFMVSGGVVGPSEGPVLLATLVVIAATVLQVMVQLVRREKVHLMLWANLVIIMVLGGATVWFHNKTFILWKPTAVYWVMGLAFWVSQAFFGRNLLQAAMGDQLELPARIWQRLSFAWIAFFALMGLLNLYVAYSFSDSTWATFKVFGATGLLLAFTLAQGVYLSRHLKDEPAAPRPEASGDGTGSKP